MIDCRVPMASSRWSGTGTVMVPDSIRCCMTMWLPRLRTSTKPCVSRIRHTSRPERTRSLPMRGFESGYKDIRVQALLDLLWRGRFQKELDGFPQIGGSLLHRSSLTGHVQLRAERHVEIALPFDDSGVGAGAHELVSSLLSCRGICRAPRPRIGLKSIPPFAQSPRSCRA